MKIFIASSLMMLMISGTAYCQLTPAKKEVQKPKPPIVVATQKVKIKQPLKITSHTDGQEAPGIIQLLGTGTPGETVTVDLYAYAEVTPKKNSPWETFKKIALPLGTYNVVNAALKQNAGSQIKERFFATYTGVIDANGKWYVKSFPTFGSPDWMRNAFIPFAWLVSASTTKNPNYQDGNVVRMRIGCK